MTDDPQGDVEGLQIARRWCDMRNGWSVIGQTGRGGTAPVFSIRSPAGELALKIHDLAFSTGAKGIIERTRIQRQIDIGQHDCPSLVRVFEGGAFEDRLYVLMNRAPGQELEKRLAAVPRKKIRQIVDQIARAAIFLRSHRLCHRDIKSANIFVSDDFDRATLLDLSVTRDIYDPIGSGTDHDGQLPVLATARYSPPEYLFRLLEPGHELWHSLDIYQLGALLHDLIMRKPLFQEEYDRSRDNRYRFAWVVATVDPPIFAEDVDQDLVFLARRALDKDYNRRAKLRLEDFLADSDARRSRTLHLLGLGVQPLTKPSAGDRHRRLIEVARSLEDGMREHLRRSGVTAKHQGGPGDDDMARCIAFHWVPQDAQAKAGSRHENELLLRLRLKETGRGLVFDCFSELNATIDTVQRHATMNMPSVDDGPDAASRLFENASATLEALALEVSRAPREGE
jgi:serine/threonine protein kinase